MRTIIAFQPIIALLLFVWGTSEGQTQNVVLDRVEIVEAGLYRDRVTQIIVDPNIAGGTINPSTDKELLSATTTVPAVVGTNFGVRFRLVGRPNGKKAKITFVTKFPPAGLRDPNTGKTSSTNQFEWEVEIGRTDARTYQFDNAWEAVPGEWSLEFWYQGRRLGGQKFSVVAQ